MKHAREGFVLVSVLWVVALLTVITLSYHHRARLEVQAARDDARCRGFAHAAHAGEDIGLMDAVGGKRIAQGAHHRLLADKIGEILRTVFPRQHPVGRGSTGGRNHAGQCNGLGIVIHAHPESRWPADCWRPNERWQNERWEAGQ